MDTYPPIWAHWAALLLGAALGLLGLLGSVLWLLMALWDRLTLNARLRKKLRQTRKKLLDAERRVAELERER